MITKEQEQAQAALDDLASLAYRDASEPDFVIDSWKKTIITALGSMAGDEVIEGLMGVIESQRQTTDLLLRLLERLENQPYIRRDYCNKTTTTERSRR